jgi:hypothetical protein
MADNKDQQDGRDRSKIDANDPSEVEYVHKQFPHLSHEEVFEAIRTKGPNREEVMNYLRSR